MPRRTRKKGSKQQRKRAVPKLARRNSLRNNPIVGGMNEAQAERILAEMRGKAD